MYPLCCLPRSVISYCSDFCGKMLGRSSLRKEGFTVAPRLKAESITVGKAWSSRPRVLLYLTSGSREREMLLLGYFHHFAQFWTPTHGIILPTFRMNQPSSDSLEVRSHTHQRCVSYVVQTQSR